MRTVDIRAFSHISSKLLRAYTKKTSLYKDFTYGNIDHLCINNFKKH